jgi:hypothetical protein
LIFQISLNIQILEYSRNISFPFSFYSYDYKIQNSSIQTQNPIILVSKFLSNYSLSNHVHIPENSKNTLVPYSTYNFPVQTKLDDSFATILTNSELYRTKPHVPSYKYTHLSSPSPHTQYPQPNPHLLSYPALPDTRLVSLLLQSTLLVSTFTPPPVISQHHMTQILLKTLPIHISPF